jgi:taurine dioxygenase
VTKSQGGRLKYRDITVSLGSEVGGIDLERDYSPHIIDELLDAIVSRGVLVFRDQMLSPARQVALGEALGELNPRHPVYESVKDHPHPDVLVLWNDKDTVPDKQLWHSDVTYQDEPPIFSVLKACRIPDVGGDTLWADMRVAYQRLPESIKTLISGLHAEHTLAHGFRYLHEPEYAALKHRREQLEKQEREAGQRNVHPLVKLHPISGEPMLYVNESFTKRIVDLPEAESSAILSMLFAHIREPFCHFRLRWTSGTVVIWDNYRTQHYAVTDHFPAYREMHRVTVARCHRPAMRPTAIAG